MTSPFLGMRSIRVGRFRSFSRRQDIGFDGFRAEIKQEVGEDGTKRQSGKWCQSEEIH